MSIARLGVTAAVGLALLGALVLSRSPRTDSNDSAPAATTPATTAAPRAAEPVPATATRITQEAAIPSPLLKFPNGVEVAPLNDVVSPAPCVWGDTPWSPIVRRETHDGLVWYVHADGTYTTTRMTWRADLGRDDAVTLCVHPTTPAPTAPAPRAANETKSDHVGPATR